MPVTRLFETALLLLAERLRRAEREVTHQAVQAIALLGSVEQQHAALQEQAQPVARLGWRNRPHRGGGLAIEAAGEHREHSPAHHQLRPAVRQLPQARPQRCRHIEERIALDAQPP